ncbi:MAG: glycerol-3-phosphate 1-O-acyltransferase PlsY [Alkalinema sp. RU_4_3]|nr:glycerol-3-phosphate 1-O-acyltransferase PlsY [Alkalinema sp. RU_4_3]
MVSIVLPVLLTLLLAYMLGSIPFGYLAAKWLKGIDIRKEGSGSTGATNVLRTLGKKAGITVLLLDVLKGFGAITAMYLLYNWFGEHVCALDDAQRDVISLLLTQPDAVAAKLSPDLKTCYDLAVWKPVLIVAAAVAAIIGHSKSVWLGFKGGKSVAVSLGVLLAMDYRVALAGLGVFLLSALVSRIVSLSSILAVIGVAVAFWGFRCPIAYLLFAIVMGAYVIWLHRANVGRLMKGTEPRIGQRVEVAVKEEG